MQAGPSRFSNTGTGTISATGTGTAVDLFGASTLENAGTIAASASGTAILFNGAGAELVLDPTSVITGQVEAVAGDTLDLAGYTAATLAGLGSQYAGFDSLVENVGAKWTVSGDSTLTGSGSILGALTVNGSLSFIGAVDGAGTVSITAGSTLAVTGDFTAKGLTFLSGANELAVFGTPDAVTASIADFAATDVIQLQGFVETGDSFMNGTLALASSSETVSLTFAGTGYTTGSFNVTTNGTDTFIHHS